MIKFDDTQPLSKEERITIAKRWFGSKANGTKVDCAQRADDNWEMIQFMPDPSLESSVVDELKSRNIPHPYRWVTVAVVEPYVIAGIQKSLTHFVSKKENI